MQTRLPGAAVAAACAALLAAGCSGSDASVTAFESDVRDARDRVDFALAYITQAQSRQDLLQRMDDASASIDRAANDLDGAGVADGFEDETDQLVDALHQLSTDLESTAEQIRQPGFGDLLGNTSGLSFESWTKANRVFRQLKQQGIDVQPLGRH